MIDLYAAPTSNGVRAKIMLDECGLPYKLHAINMQQGDHKKPEFLKLNPNGAIPVIVDNDGPGGKPVTTAQSAAILIYLAEKSGRFIPKDPAGRAQMWEALMSAATDVGPMLGTVFTINRAKDGHKPTAEMFAGKLKGYFKVWDDKLAKQKYCVGDEVSIADFALYGAIARCNQVSPELTAGYANLARWEKEIAGRSGVQKGMKFA